MRPPPPTPGLPGIDWDVPAGKGYRFARLPLPALDAIPRGTTRDVFQVLTVHYRPGRPIRLTNESIAKQARCDAGSVRRALAWLKSHCPPDDPSPFVLVGGNNADRVIWILCRPLEPGESAGGSDASYQSDRARAGAQGGGARARAPLDASPCAPTPAVRPSFLDSRELKNVNVEALPEKPPACVREPASPGPAGPPPEGVDRELAGLTVEQLRERIDALDARHRSLAGGSCKLRVQVWSELAQARAVLEAREGPQEPPPTPKVESIGPRPAITPAATPAAPAPSPGKRPEFFSLLGRLKRVAGPGPLDDFARFVAESLHDGHSLAHHRRIAAEIRSGKVDPKRAAAAYRMARNGAMAGTARSPGAIYTAHIRNLE